VYIPRLLILPLLISVCVAAQPVPGNVKLLGKRYACVEPEPQAEPAWIKNLFPRPVLFQRLPTSSFHQDGMSLARIVPPPEFRVDDFTVVDTSGVTLLGPRWHLCHGIYVANGRIHGNGWKPRGVDAKRRTPTPGQ